MGAIAAMLWASAGLLYWATRRGAAVYRMVRTAKLFGLAPAEDSWGLVELGPGCRPSAVEVSGAGESAGTGPFRLVAGRAQREGGRLVIKSTGKRSMFTVRTELPNPRRALRRAWWLRQAALFLMVAVPIAAIVATVVFADQMPPFAWPEGD